MSNAFASNLLLDLTTELLRQGTTVRFRPSGRSMYPSIREGELVTVEPVVASDVTLGDIVLYRSEMGVIAHRVIQVSRPQSELSAYRAAGFSLRALFKRRHPGVLASGRCLPLPGRTRWGGADFRPGHSRGAGWPQRCPGQPGSQIVAHSPQLGLWAQRVDLYRRDRFSP